jgi:anti-sigma regulatory factor (Ser/Thr protein kinase)
MFLSDRSEPTMKGFDVVLTQGVAAGAAARRAVLEGNGALPTTVRDDVLLLVSELVTNAVRHAGAGPDRPVRLELRCGLRRVRVVIADEGPGFTWHQATPAGPTASGGWGLFFVDRLADCWGVERTPTGSRVWFEIAYGEDPAYS